MQIISFDMFKYFKVSNLNKILILLMYLYVFLLPFSKSFSVYTGPYILIIFWLIINRKKILNILKDKLILFLLMFSLFQLVTLYWSNDFEYGLYSLKNIFSFAIVFLIFYTTKINFKIALSIFLTAMFISEIASYFAVFDIYYIKHATKLDPSPFMHHVRYSIFLAITIIILLSKFLLEDIKLSKFFIFLFFLSTSINLLSNGGRTGQLAFILSIFVFFLIYKKSIKTVVVLLPLLLTILIAAYKISPVFNHRANMAIHNILEASKGNFDTSWGLRVVMKKEALPIIKENFLLGVGIGDVKSSFAKHIEKTDYKNYEYLKHINHIHDQVLQILMQSGLIGFFLFFGFLYNYLIKINDYERADPLFLSCVYSILTIFAVVCVADIPIWAETAGLFGVIFPTFLKIKEELQSIPLKSIC